MSSKGRDAFLAYHCARSSSKSKLSPRNHGSDGGGQGVKLYFQHQVTRTYPSPKGGDDGAVVAFTDLAKDRKFSIFTKKAVLNIPSEVRVLPYATRAGVVVDGGSAP